MAKKKQIRAEKNKKLAVPAGTRKARKKTTKKKTTKRSYLKICTKWLLIAAVWGLSAVVLVLLYYSQDLPNIDKFRTTIRKPSITITAQADNQSKPIILAQYGDSYGRNIKSSELPKHFIDALLATEDRRFYQHFGIDVFGLTRAMIVNIQAGGIVQGGSTLTQQLAKNMFLNSERTIKRKVQEMILALWLEYNFTKDEIMTLYLNMVYFGSGNYGIDGASRFYFNKPASKMNLPESAMMVGLLKAPSYYAPNNHPERAVKRAKQILINMRNNDSLSDNAIYNTKFPPIEITPSGRGTLRNPYFADWIVDEASNLLGHISDDVVIKTTFNHEIQKVAEKALIDNLNKYNKSKRVSQGAAIVMSPTGEVLAMVGGKNYKQSSYNRATQAMRQPGSLFKLFVYAEAFAQGYTPDDIVNDKPVTISKWSPKNYGNKYYGEVSLKTAFAKSLNSVAVRLAQKAGTDNIITLARLLGINSPLKRNLSIALGTSEVNLLEINTAYAHFANNGNQVRPFGITEIRKKDGEIIYSKKTQQENRVISKQVTAHMNQLMTEVVRNGTGRKAKISEDAAGKTGTSQASRDAWFSGFSSEYVTTIWVGNDNATPMKRVTGGTIPAMIWHDIMDKLHITKDGKRIPTRPNQVDKDYNSIWDSIVDHFSSGDTQHDYPKVRHR